MKKSIAAYLTISIAILLSQNNNSSLQGEWIFESMTTITKAAREEITIVYKDKNNVPRPKHWSGWCLDPLSIEFWVRVQHRIHERLKYNKVSNNWKREILYP